MQSSESEAIILSFVACALARFWMFLLSGLKTIAPCATYATGVWIKIFGVKYHSDLLQDCVAEAWVKPSSAWSWTQGKSPAWSKDIPPRHRNSLISAAWRHTSPAWSWCVEDWVLKTAEGCVEGHLRWRLTEDVCVEVNFLVWLLDYTNPNFLT